MEVSRRFFGLKAQMHKQYQVGIQVQNLSSEYEREYHKRATARSMGADSNVVEQQRLRIRLCFPIALTVRCRNVFLSESSRENSEFSTPQIKESRRPRQFRARNVRDIQRKGFAKNDVFDVALATANSMR